MAKTAKEIVGDIMDLIKADPIAKLVDGRVYRQGFRPRDSKLEDIVVIHTAGVPGRIGCHHSRLRAGHGIQRRDGGKRKPLRHH